MPAVATTPATGVFATPPLSARMLDVKPTLPRACEIEALAWSTTTGWSDAPLPGLPTLLRRIARALFAPRRSEDSGAGQSIK